MQIMKCEREHMNANNKNNHAKYKCFRRRKKKKCKNIYMKVNKFLKRCEKHGLHEYVRTQKKMSKHNLQGKMWISANNLKWRQTWRAMMCT